MPKRSPMVNLVIISDSPKTEHIKQYLHATLKVTIDVVTDIDQALQDIFVKRPTVVCIQDRISDIKAGDIARHFQMLFKNGAPSFILMHEGDGSAKPVKGIFEHLIDLTLPEAELAVTLGAALRSILGAQWEQVCLSPPPGKDKPLQAAGTTLKPFREYSGAEEHDAFVLVDSLDEFMTTMPQARVSGQESNLPPDEAPVTAAPHAVETPAVPPRNNAPSRQQTVEQGRPGKRATHDSLSPKNTATPPETDVASPGDFRIAATTRATAPREQKDIHPFINNFELPARRWRRRAGIALAIAICATACYLLWQKPETSIATPSPPPTAAAGQQSQAPAPTAAHKAVSSARPPLGYAASPLPEFIPANGRDSVYATRNPGWERYAGADYECRIFRENNRIKAVQVLPTQRRSLDGGLLRKVLGELVGDARYRVTSREHVREYLVERASVADKADLMLYNKKSKLHAFVISLN